MPWLTRLTAPLLIAVAALACADQPEMQITDPQAEIAGGPACKLSDLKAAARTFFGLRSPGYNKALEFTTQNVNKTAVLPIFFDLAHLIAVKAGPGTLTASQAAAGAEVHRRAVACAPVVDPDYNDNMDNVEAALGPNGAYEVRGRTGTDNAVVLSHNTGDHGSSGIKAPPGVAPSGGFQAWANSEVIFYGFTQTDQTDPFQGEASAAPGEPAVFHWFTVRRAGTEFSETLRGLVGVCVSTLQDLDATQFRIQHEELGDGGVVLPISTFDVCNASSLIHSPGLSPINSALAWLHRHLAPTPLQAATAVVATTTSPSGSIKKFSPVGAVNPGEAEMEFVPSVIPDTPIDEGLDVKVRVTGAGNVPWEGLNIKLIAFDNNGSFTLSPDTATTNELGEADFTQSIVDKPGVYKLLAITQPGVGGDPDAGGFTQDSVVSGNFHRTPN